MNTMLKMDLCRFDSGTTVHTTTGYMNTETGKETPYSEIEGLSAEMKTYYSDYLIDNAEPRLIHDQFAQKIPVPAGNGKTVQFRKYDPLPRLSQPLVEGVTPDGQTLTMSTVEATVHQYGGYVELSDLLLLSAVDNNLVAVTKLLGAQAGKTLDAITREVLCGGTNVQYADGAVSSRHLLVGGAEEGNHYLSVDCIKRAVRFLKKQGAEKIDGAYACIIHPDCAYDLMNDLNWKYPYQYADTQRLFEGEIGMLEGVRFVESPEAKTYSNGPLLVGSYSVGVSKGGYRELETGETLAPATGGVNTKYVLQILEEPEMSVVGREVMINDVSEGSYQYAKILGFDNTTFSVYLDRPLYKGGVGSTKYSAETGDIVYAADCGYQGRTVYVTLLFGENAYGTTEITGGGLEHIVKQLGSGGTADPLNQRATVGWKATKAAVRLMEPFMIRIETASTFDGDN